MGSGPDTTGQVPPNPIPDHPRYAMIAYVNRGRHGFVVRALDKESNQEVAIKFLERTTGDSKYVSREILNQYKLCHPHVIGLLDIFLTNRYLALVLEYANFGDLHTYVMSRRGVSEPEARWFFQQLILAVDFCHRMGVVNRDIKLENTLLAGDTRPLVKLSDFGFSKDEHGQSAPTTRVGTVMYMAPEVVSNGPDAVYDAKKADVWSCGVVLYAMLTGKYPFKRDEDNTLSKVQGVRAALQRILKGDFAYPTNVSPESVDLLRKMLQPDPADRLSVDEVMVHPWYKEGLSPGVEGYNASVIAQAEQQQGVDDPTLNRIKAVLAELQSSAWTRRASVDIDRSSGE